MIDRFPALTAPTAVGQVAVQYLHGAMPEDALIAHVNIVPFVGNSVVVVRLADGRHELPGGTREPGEPWRETIRRELLEEAGAALRSFITLGAWREVSSAAEPYRPHLPHPIAFRLLGYGDVDLVGIPGNPPGAEQVAEVLVISIDEAGARFRADGRPDLADAYALADFVRRTRDAQRP